MRKEMGKPAEVTFLESRGGLYITVGEGKVFWTVEQEAPPRPRHKIHLLHPGHVTALCNITMKPKGFTSEVEQVTCKNCLGMDVTGRNREWYEALKRRCA